MEKKEKRMREAVQYMRDYMNTYDQQCGYTEYSDKTYINDVLYGLGVSLDKKYKYSDGFRKFRKLLLQELVEDE